MNGAMAARLAVGNPRVTAVACGGFPLTADLTGMAERARGRNARRAGTRTRGRSWWRPTTRPRWSPSGTTSVGCRRARWPPSGAPSGPGGANRTTSCPRSSPRRCWSETWSRTASSTTSFPGSTTPRCSTGSTWSCRHRLLDRPRSELSAPRRSSSDEPHPPVRRHRRDARDRPAVEVAARNERRIETLERGTRIVKPAWGKSLFSTSNCRWRHLAFGHGDRGGAEHPGR